MINLTDSAVADVLDYREFRAATKDAHLRVSREPGELLYILASAQRARVIVEVGTSFGVSTLALATALQDNYGGKRGIVICTESQPARPPPCPAHSTRPG